MRLPFLNLMTLDPNLKFLIFPAKIRFDIAVKPQINDQRYERYGNIKGKNPLQAYNLVLFLHHLQNTFIKESSRDLMMT